MKKSESIKNLAIALSKFQGDVTNPTNTKENPFFKSNYAPLEAVINTVKPILAKHGLSVIQMPVVEDEKVGVITVLMHDSGEYVETESLVLKTDKNTAQGAGSAITYARRYALSAVLGIASEEDDDGNIAETKNKQQYKNNKNRSFNNTNTNNNLATDSQINTLISLAKQKNYTDNMPGYIKNNFNKNSSKELTKQEASELIQLLQSMK